MIVLGLTGGMAAGKTTVAQLFARAGWPVFDADAEVHCLQARDGAAVPAIAARWPAAVHDGMVDRVALRRAVIGQPGETRALEAIVHPLIRAARRRFLHRMRRRRVAGCVLDIPLLFETGADRDCDVTLVVTAPLSVRLGRIRRRRSLSEAQARALIARQMDDALRRRRADHVIRTGLSRFQTRRQVEKLIRTLETRA